MRLARSVAADFQRIAKAGEGLRATGLLHADDGLLSRHARLLSVAEGPMEAWRRAGLFDLNSPFRKQMHTFQAMVDQNRALFRLPGWKEARGLLDQFRAHDPSAVFRNVPGSFLQRAAQSMHSPWLHSEDVARSVAGFAKLHGIGHALVTMPSFSDEVTRELRVSLGDWRDKINWPKPIFSDFIARTDFYVDRGLDTTLTEFPSDAFQECLDGSGLREVPPDLGEVYGPPIPEPDSWDERVSLDRTSSAYTWLLRFETNIRQFNDGLLTTAFGSDWPRHRLPNGLYEKWLDKKRAAELDGTSQWPLIDYADFTDYERIICRQDNWKAVFGPIFDRPESVRESLQRLHPIRICTMHARPITQDDELFLYVELRRLGQAIEKGRIP